MHARTFLLSLLAAAWIGLVLLAGCSGPAAGPAPTPTPTPAMTPTPQPLEGTTFTQADNGGTYPVSPGEVAELRLAENPTTGYTWNLSLTPGLTLVNDRYIPDDPTGQLIGSGGTHVWFVEAAGTGEQVITGSYRRSWEAPAGTAPDFTLTLLVGGETCSAGGDVCTIPTVSLAVPPRYHVYTEADSGKTVQEPLGETLGLSLQENPSTGYSWNLSLTKGLTLSSDEYIPPTTGGQLTGAGGVRSFTLVTTGRGDQLARAEYRRHWITAGTITYLNQEGGFYGIIGDDGTKYEPMNLDAKYQKDGLRVAFEYTPAQMPSTIHKWGMPVRLDSIEEIPVFSLKVTVT
jgi:inhibitor of cysteine peptidase